VSGGKVQQRVRVRAELVADDFVFASEVRVDEVGVVRVDAVGNVRCSEIADEVCDGGDVRHHTGDLVDGGAYFQADLVTPEQGDEFFPGGSFRIAQLDTVADAVRQDGLQHPEHALRAGAVAFADMVGDFQACVPGLAHHGGGFAEPAGVEFERA